MTDRRARKQMTMHQGSHLRSDVDGLKRAKGVRGLMSVEDTMKYKRHSIKNNTETSKIVMIRTSRETIKSDSKVKTTDVNVEVSARKRGWNTGLTNQ